MVMSTAYEMSGRTQQKHRTRGALVAAAGELLARGVTPTVEQTAEAAGISRTTAYRIEEALAPCRAQLSESDLRMLVLAIRSAIGIEALVWLTDVAGLSRVEAAELTRWSALALLRSALVLVPDGDSKPR